MGPLRLRVSRRLFLIVQQVKLFAGLEAHSFSRRDRHFRAGARIAADPRLARAHVEYAESPQFNAIAGSQRLLEALKDGIDCDLRLLFRGSPVRSIT